MAKWNSAAARRIKELANSKTVELAAIEIGRRLTEGQQLPPTDLEPIFPRVGIVKSYADPTLLVAGELRQGEDGFEVAFTDTDSEPRRRFTIAHEISHAVIERTGPHCPRRGKELEKICDMIASQILVPRHVLLRVACLPMRLKEVERLARVFNVSLTMMAIRCAGEFSMVCGQLEYDELQWCTTGSSLGISRPKVQLKKLLAKTESQRSGDEPFTFESNGRQVEGRFEWVATGSDRKLCLIRRA